MADNNKIKVDELNFEGIKANLKGFLSGQEQFKDYDFEGSNLSVLVDLLAYNTYYNSIYNNLSLNEMFLDSASKRDSVVSISKMLGYTPKSTTSARAIINATVSLTNADNPPTKFTIPKYTQFNSSVNEKTFYFCTTEERTAVRSSSGTYIFDNLTLVEGKNVVEKYVVAPGVRFIVSNQMVDTSTIKVYVSETSTTGDPDIYNLSTNITTADGNTKIFFLNEIENGQYEVSFGDGVIGKKLSNGNLVTIEYIVSSGSEANGCRAFRGDVATTLQSARISTTLVSQAQGGDEAESINSVKFNAPRAFFSQNRAVTTSDYASVIFQNFSNVQAVNVWSGDQNIPAVYGKVFVCVRPKSGTLLSDEEKLNVKNILKSKSIVTIQTEIVDPIYLDVQVECAVYYNPKDTVNSPSAIADIVKTTILNYNTSELQKFDAVFKQSRLSRLIDMSEKSIQSNVTTIKLHREITPKFNVNAQYVIRLGNPIYTEGVPEKVVTTTGFYLYGNSTVHYLRDDGVGNMVMYYMDGNAEVVANRYIGTVDYANGIVTITGLNIQAIEGNKFEMIVSPESYDVIAIHDHLLNIPSELINVTTITDTSGSAYKFTSSRS